MAVNYAELREEYRNRSSKSSIWPVLACLGLLLASMVLLIGCAQASEPNYSQYANVIYKVENSRTHPYGIMQKYKHTTPRQACINTVKHQYKNWNKAGTPGKFTHWLAIHYAPVGVSNDPHNLNVNWEKNFYYIAMKINIVLK